MMDADSPVLWMRVDPELTLMRKIKHRQPDYMWQYQAKFERHIVGQLEAIKELENYNNHQTTTVLTEIIENDDYYYKVSWNCNDI